MTIIEKLIADEKIREDDVFDEFKCRCPGDYGFKDEKCFENGGYDGNDLRCLKCWTREVEE